MSFEIIKKINVDFYSNKLIYVNAKQNDMSRFLLLTCYNQGQKVSIDNITNSAYVRCKKSDNNGILNQCMITEDGEIMVELTEQMLAVPGNVLTDILVYDTTGIVVSTMNFCINVIATSFDNSEIESSNEYKALNELIIEAKAEYDYVIEQSGQNLSIAIEQANNAKISADAAKVSENNALISEQNAKVSENASKTSEQNALVSEQNAKISEEAAKISEDNAFISEQNAESSENNALVSETNAKASELAAKLSESNASASEQNAKTYSDNAKASENSAKASKDAALVSEQKSKLSETNASTSESNALVYSNSAEESKNEAKQSEDNAKISENISTTKATEASTSAELAKTYSEQAKISLDSIDESANVARSYAVGDTGLRENEATDNAKYYFEQTKMLAGNQETATLNEVQEYIGII